MHEFPVTQSLLEIALRHAREGNATKITDLHLVLGAWSSILDDSIQYYWDIISENTIARGARLHFRRIPVILSCEKCGREYEPGADDFSCPNCHSTSIKVISGEEFFLEAIDVE
jgi:hydrogenase nickel incorporation protein HypA/HybF